jgi:large subunit ribosomal protein L14
MLKVGSYLRVVDNSGAKWAKCINIKKKGKYVSATIGMLILITLKKISNRKKVNKRIIYLGLIVGVSYWVYRVDGTFVKFFTNRLLLFNKQIKFLGSRIYGIFLKEIKVKNFGDGKNQKYFHKIFLYSSGVI